jgi:AbrB family looped-hinge helix DNA binding protein
MTYTVTLTSQGQISIPAALRRKIGLTKSGRALITEKGGKLTIEPVKDLLELRGALKTDIVASPSQLRRAFEDYMAQKKPSR